jgi:hypothetical protein
MKTLMRMLRGRSMRSSLNLAVVGIYLIMLHRFISPAHVVAEWGWARVGSVPAADVH